MLKIISRLLMSLAMALIFLLPCGCASTSAKLNHVKIGMTKTELVRAIGTPDIVSTNEKTEYFTYFLGNPNESAGMRKAYYVCLKNGRVDSYGERGDFDSTKPPTINVNVQKQ
jgi:hypothetical protein